MANDQVSALAQAQGKSYLEAPAGFGKTELIARALAICEGRQLVLTHTHAGVDSIRKRLKVLGVPTGSHRVETIDAFCVRFAQGYPQTSGSYDIDIEDKEYWDKIKVASSMVFNVDTIRRLFSEQYSGVIVDEYQDCSKLQHEIIESIAARLPLRVLGDPLQSLLSWKGQDPIDWVNQVVKGGYSELPPLTEPQRWMQQGSDHELGKWLQEARAMLGAGQPVCYKSPVALSEVSTDKFASEILKYVYALKRIGTAGESIVVIHQKFRHAKQTESRPDLQTNDPFATALSGEHFSVLMEIEGRLLKNWCKELEGLTGLNLALLLLEFVDVCCSKKSAELKPLVSALSSSKLPGSRATKCSDLTEYLKACEPEFSLRNGEGWIRALASFESRKIHHRELFYGMCRVLRAAANDKLLSLADAARKVRELESHRGRKPDRRIIARPILIKGLQFDHVIVVGPESMTACEQYVAFSRAVKSLAVVTADKRKIKGISSKLAVSPEAGIVSASEHTTSQQSLFD